MEELEIKKEGITPERIFATVGLLAFYLIAGSLIRIPFLDGAVLEKIRVDVAGADNNILDYLDVMLNFSLFALGVFPLISARIFVRTISIVKRLICRDSTRGLSHENRIILVLTAILTPISAFGLGLYYYNYLYFGETITYLVDREMSRSVFIAITILSLTGGAAVLIWVIHRFRKLFLVNGYLLILVAHTLLIFPFGSFRARVVNFVEANMPQDSVQYRISSSVMAHPEDLNAFKVNLEGYLKKRGKTLKYQLDQSVVTISGIDRELKSVQNALAVGGSFAFQEEDQRSLEL